MASATPCVVLLNPSNTRSNQQVRRIESRSKTKSTLPRNRPFPGKDQPALFFRKVARRWKEIAMIALAPLILPYWKENATNYYYWMRRSDSSEPYVMMYAAAKFVSAINCRSFFRFAWQRQTNWIARQLLCSCSGRTVGVSSRSRFSQFKTKPEYIVVKIEWIRRNAC